MASERAAELPSWNPTPRFEAKSEYVLSELLRFDDLEFIEVAYRALLRREPDLTGREGYLNALRGGSTSKVEILGSMRFSEEGRKCGVHVDGLLLPYKLHQWRHRPLVGPVLGFLMAVARLPRLALRLQSMEARAAQENQQVGIAVNRLARAVEQKLLDVQESASSDAEFIVAQSFATLERSFGAGRAFARDGGRAGFPESAPGSAVHEERAKPGVDPAAFASAVRTALAAPISAEEALHSGLLPLEDAVTYARRAADSIERGIYAHTRAVNDAAHERLLRAQAEFQRMLGGFAEHDELTSLEGRLHALEGQLADLTHVIGATSSETNDHITAIKQVLSTKAEETKVSALQAAIEELKPALRDGIEAAGRAVENLAQNVLATRRELLQLRIERAAGDPHALTGPAPSTAIGSGGTDPDALDSLYVALEDQFRGSRELITERCQAYLPYIRSALKRAGGGAVLDIGCGRGEWLEVLREAGIEARGIDLNKLQILDCRAAGLDVQEAEAIGYLRALADASLAAVTGFHIVEHIPFPSLVVLFDEVYRVLKPGGVATFETPNPENQDVGACTFYMDPTHLHPLPPALLEFLALTRGLGEVEIRRLTEHRPTLVAPAVVDSNNPNSEAIQWLLDRSRERLCVASDYAVIGWKAEERMGASGSGVREGAS